VAGSDSDRHEVLRRFEDAVNMAPKELEDWLATDESRSVGDKDGGGEATGHRMGRRIVELRRKRNDDLTEDDLAAMRKVAGYVARHTAQGGPGEDMEHSAWRYSLMNWGHDPAK
jgi:hypothetical protein